MSSVARDMIEEHESTARRIQEFIWEGKPFKSNKRVHTVEELESFLENLRLSSWDTYNSGADYMGWNGYD